jgi:N-ethylmaleimide reductase
MAADEIGSSRTGIAISPGHAFNDIIEDDTAELYTTLLTELIPLNLAFLHVSHGGDEQLIERMRRQWAGPFVLNRPNADIELRMRDVEDGLADVISIGTQALANPDLVERIRRGAPLNEPDRSTFYGGGERGYIDYPTLSLFSL